GVSKEVAARGVGSQHEALELEMLLGADRRKTAEDPVVFPDHVLGPWPVLECELLGEPFELLDRDIPEETHLVIEDLVESSCRSLAGGSQESVLSIGERVFFARVGNQDPKITPPQGHLKIPQGCAVEKKSMVPFPEEG